MGLNVGVVAAEVDAAVGPDIRSDDLSVLSIMITGRKYDPGLLLAELAFDADPQQQHLPRDRLAASRGRAPFWCTCES